MIDPMLIEAPLETEADYEAAIDRYLIAIEQTLREIEKTQENTMRLREATDANLREIRAIMEKSRQ